MQQQTSTRPHYFKVEKELGSLKFAVIIISLFALAMAIGTFLESYYGTDFANRMLYKRLPFMLLQVAMFLSILYAFFLRLPWKKNLSGFYLIHSGLIITGIGAFATYYSGIDGNMTLMPRTPERRVSLSNDQLTIHFPASGRQVSYELPYTALASSINQRYNDIELVQYFPFASTRLVWDKPLDQTQRHTHSGRYRIQNANVSEEFVLTLHPESRDYQSNVTMGPLQIHYLPESMAECFGKIAASQLILWDAERNSCFTPEERKLTIKETSSGKRFLVVQDRGNFYSFFPEFSPFPMDKDFNVDSRGTMRIFSLRMFQEGRHLFLFGNFAAFSEKNKDNVEQWSVIPLTAKKPIDLPWMGFELTLMEHHTEMIPKALPVYEQPIQVNGELKRGGLKAVQLKVRGREIWVTDKQSASLELDGEKINFRLEKEHIILPFEVSLDQFKMDKDPGTNNPASYESFVKIFDRRGPSSHHIFMNNPLKYDWFTMYQASYFETEQGGYGSVLSVNVDPGRPLKYFGCLLLVLGSMLHYYLRRPRQKTKSTAHVAESHQTIGETL